VTVNTDNRLMSVTTLTEEFAKLCDAFDYSTEQVRWFCRNAAKSAFAPYEVRRSLIERINKSD
jgi:adenosine deaminase